MLNVVALERGGNVQGQLEIERVDRTAKCPVLRRRIEEHERQGERNEETRGETTQELKGQQQRQGRRERRGQRENREKDRGIQQYAPRPEGIAHPYGRDRDEHLRHGLRRGNPGAFVKTRAERAANVGLSEIGEPPVQG